jgi:hypothetical protein
VPERVPRLEVRAGREQHRRNGAVTRGVKRDVTLEGVTHVQSHFSNPVSTGEGRDVSS